MSAYDDRIWVKHYPPGIASDMELPDFTLVDHFEKIRSEFSGETALHFLGVTMTYGELMSHANRFAQALICHGIGLGDIVGIDLPNCPQYLIAQIGALKAGCAVSGVSPLLTSPELAYQVEDSKARVLVTLDAIFEHRFLEISGQLPDLKLVIVTGILDFLPWIKRKAAKLLRKVPFGRISAVEGKTVLKLSEILMRFADTSPTIKVRPDDHCLIMYTGGTTGIPKGTIITHRNMVSELVIVTTWLDMQRGKEVILSAFPLFHIAGLALGLGTIFIGSVQILIPNPRDTKHVVKEMAKYRPTILVNVPSLYMMLLEQKGFKELDFSRLGFCLSAASPFPVEPMNQLERVIGQGKMLECYGMTEVSSLVTMNPRRGLRKVGSVGVPLPNTKIKLMDLVKGDREIPLGEEGEIVVAGPQVMKGYLGRPEETSLALLDHDGEPWLHTGDIGRMDLDGFVTIVDRAKDMLNVGGFKVFSREVEDKLHEHPAIEFCAIVGVPNPKRPGTDIVKLIVQASPQYRDRDRQELTSDVMAFARKNFAPYKVPKIIEFVENIPLTTVGKVDKKALK